MERHQSKHFVKRNDQKTGVFSNHSWVVDCAVLGLSLVEQSVSQEDSLTLAIVSDIYSQTIVGYHFAPAAIIAVAIAALLHTSSRKSYPPDSSLRVLWTTGDAPKYLVIDEGVNELTNLSTHLRSYPETRNIQLLRCRANQHFSAFGSLEQLLQSLSVHRLNDKAVSQRPSSPLTPISPTSEEFERLLVTAIVTHNEGIHPRTHSKTRYQVWDFGLRTSFQSK